MRTLALLLLGAVVYGVGMTCIAAYFHRCDGRHRANLNYIEAVRRHSEQRDSTRPNLLRLVREVPTDETR